MQNVRYRHRVKNEPSEPYQRVSQIFERNGLREITRKKIVLYLHLQTQLGLFQETRIAGKLLKVLSVWSVWYILLTVQYRSLQRILISLYVLYILYIEYDTLLIT